MRHLKVGIDTSEKNIYKLLNYVTTISALKAVELFEKHNIFDYFTRSRSPEEIFHLLNFSNLEQLFPQVFDILAYKGLLIREGEFYKLSHNFHMLLNKLREERSNIPNEVMGPIDTLFDNLLKRYLAILNGEYGRIDHEALYETLDRLYGTEFMLAIIERYYRTIINKLPGIKEKDRIHILNWGVGSGYDALLLAQLYGRKVDVISVEPDGTIEKAYVLQDFYGIYNVQFIERKDFNPQLIRDSVEIFISRHQQLSALKGYVEIALTTLSPEGYLTAFPSTELSLSFNWIFSIFSDYSSMLPKDQLIAILKHYGLGRVKYLGFNNDLIALQRLH